LLINESEANTNSELADSSGRLKNKKIILFFIIIVNFSLYVQTQIKNIK